MKLPSHNTVIAYLALFVALGGTAFAASQLPKNSVGTKQLKSNAVTTAKIKNGAVTGAKIADSTVTGANVAESTLGRVPSAGTAESAATAAHAANATKAGHASTAGDASSLGGIPSSGFLRTSDVFFGSSTTKITFEATIVEVPGRFRIKTMIGPYNEHKFNVTNLSSQNWIFLADSGSAELAPGNSTGMNFGTEPTADIFAISKANANDHALIDCGFESGAAPNIFCSVRVSPAA